MKNIYFKVITVCAIAFGAALIGKVQEAGGSLRRSRLIGSFFQRLLNLSHK